MKNDGGPAFPYDVQRNGRGHHDGMSLRDYFAGQALSGVTIWAGTATTWEDIAQRAYLMADAVLAEREKKR